MKFLSKFRYTGIHSWKHILICNLHNVRHFVQASELNPWSLVAIWDTWSVLPWAMGYCYSQCGQQPCRPVNGLQLTPTFVVNLCTKCCEWSPWVNDSVVVSSGRHNLMLMPYFIYRKISNIICIKYPNLNVSRLVLQLSLPNPMKPCVKSRMKM